MPERLEQIPAALDGQRLDRVVSLVTGCSRADAAVLVEQGGARVDGAVVTVGKQRLTEGQELVIDDGLLPVDHPPVADADVRLVVVHEDADVVVVDKPVGLVVHPGSGNERGTLVNGLLARFPEIAGVGDPSRPGIVHRLDKETSGLLVVARSRLAYERLVESLAARDVERTYLAVVAGVPGAPRGVIDAPIARSTKRATRMAVTVDGRFARTRYELLRTFHHPLPAALLECRLETGRTHQIRVHLAAIGHPVLGDRDYGGWRDGIRAARPMLHAHRLSFAHPRTDEPLSFESPLPDDIEALLASLS